MTDFNNMIEKIKRINNPLTIIAIFAALAEINATIAITLIDKSLHSIFIWFVIGFPTMLVLLFFITLNFNTKVMYSPSDYKDDKNFMDALYGPRKSTDEDKLSKFSTELEKNITEKIEEKLNKINTSKNPEIDKEINELKSKIKSITEETLVEVKSMFSLPTDLKEILLEMYRFPAFYILIYVIVISKATNRKILENISKKYYIPGDWENSGLPSLFEKGILSGNIDNFKIEPKYEKNIIAWVNKNSTKLKAMSKSFRLASSDEKDSNRHMNRINGLASRLEF